MSRTRAAAFCAGLSTAAVAAMSAMIVLVGGGPCDLRGCHAGAVRTVSSTTAAATPATSARCSAAPVPTPPTAPPSPQVGCAAPGATPRGGMETGRVPAP